MNRELLWRWSFFLIGLLVLGLGIALTIKGKALGIGPWDVFHYGLFLQFGLTIGSWSIIMGFILLAITSFATKSLPKIGAILNMLLLGLCIDLFNFLLPNPETLLVQVIAFISGVIILGYGIGLYVSADLGAGPRDGVMLLIVEATGWKVTWVRNGIEILVFLLGWMLGGPVGIGTIIIAFMLGKIISISMPQCQKLLHFFINKTTVKEHISFEKN
ncbi:YitT family protein [Bacillus tianshenii]|nr:YitT family protein [Bacillus tianshenii]